MKSNTNKYKQTKREINRTQPQGLTGGFGIQPIEEDGADSTFHFEGVDYPSELVIVKNDDILTATEVDPSNERNQEWLNRYTLHDLIHSIVSLDSSTQSEPAIGYRNASGVIMIINGSRRRMATHFSGVNFLVRVLSKDLSKELSLLSRLSRHLNIHRDISIFERGLVYEKYKTSNKGVNDKSIAVHFGVTAPVVSLALRSNTIPKSWVNAIPYPSETSNRGVQWLLSLMKKLANTSPIKRPYDIDGEIQKVADLVKSSEVLDSKKNSEFFKLLDDKFRRHFNRQKEAKSEFKSFGDKSMVKVTESKGNFKLELKDSTDKQSLEFLSELEVLLRKYKIKD